MKELTDRRLEANTRLNVILYKRVFYTINIKVIFKLEKCTLFLCEKIKIEQDNGDDNHLAVAGIIRRVIVKGFYTSLNAAKSAVQKVSLLKDIPL